nr:hypothetical protein [Tanacetum cinerariifolium]
MSSFVTSMLNPISDAGVESIFTTASSPIVSLQTPTPIMTPSTIATITTSRDAPIPPTTIPSIILENLPMFNSAFHFDERLRSLETTFSEYRQTNPFVDAVSVIPENDKFLRNIDENMKKIIKGQVKSQVKEQVSRILPRIEESVNATLEAEVLTRSSHSSRTSYAIVADLSETELKKILIEKMEGNKSIQRSDEQQNLYKALVEAYDADKAILDTYGESTILKQRREDDDQKGAFARSDRGSKGQREGGEHASASTPSETATESAGRSTTGSQSRQLSASESVFTEEPANRPPSPDHDWNQTLPATQGDAQSWISVLARQTDARSSFNELLDTPIDFSKFIMNRLKVDTLTPTLLADQLDWVNPQGQQYPHNLLQLLPLIPDNRGAEKLRQARPLGSFPLGAETLAVLWRRVEDLQLGVESYQKRLNLTKPDTYRPDLKQREAYTAYSNPRGFIYQNKDKKNRLMWINELYKFSDRTLNDVHNALDDRLKGIRMQYLPTTIWRRGDKDRAAAMIQSIDKMLKTRRIMRSLEKRSEEQKNLYKALVEAYEADKIILDTYGECVILKRTRDDDDDQEEPVQTSSQIVEPSHPVFETDRGSKRQRKGKEPESASAPLELATRSACMSTTGSKSRQASASEFAFVEEPVQTSSQIEEPSHPVFETGAEDQPIVQSSQHTKWFSQPKKPPTLDRDWNKTLPAAQGSTQTWISELEKQADSRFSFNELLDTPLDFSNFIMNRIRVDTLTPELLAGPTYELMKGSCNSLTELEYHLEEVYKATTDQLDWVNPEATCGRSLTESRKLPEEAQPYQARHIPIRSEATRSVYYLFKPIGFIYQNKDKKNRLMRIDELHKFSDGTLNDVRNALDDRLKGIRMQYLPQTIWRKGDKDRAAAMIQAIDRMLKTRRIIRSLERFVGGRLFTLIVLSALRRSDNENTLSLINLILRSILTNLQVTPTKPGLMTKPYSSHRFIANCFIARNFKRRWRPQLKSNQVEDKVMLNNSQGKKQEVEEHRRNVKFSKKKRTKMPMVVPISTRKPKRTVNQSVAKPLRRTVASESTNKKPGHTTRKLCEHVSKACSWWYSKFTPPGYKWKPKSQTGNVNPNVSRPLGNASRTANILEPMTPRCSNVLNTTLYSTSFAARRDNPIHHRLWVLKAHDGKSKASN